MMGGHILLDKNMPASYHVAMADLTSLQFDILTALASGRRHGYALVEELERISSRRPGVATVYAALGKLEGAGLVEPVTDEIVDGRVRRYYALTRPGSQALATQARKMAKRAEVAMTSLGLSGAIA
jgi:DNA-binding PadR family transcriptional regulator